MSDKSSGGSSGMGLCSVLFVIFLVLKLVGVIDWSWFFVFLPLIIGAGIWLVIFLVSLIVISIFRRR